MPEASVSLALGGPHLSECGVLWDLKLHLKSSLCACDLCQFSCGASVSPTLDKPPGGLGT